MGVRRGDSSHGPVTSGRQTANCPTVDRRINIDPDLDTIVIAKGRERGINMDAMGGSLADPVE